MKDCVTALRAGWYGDENYWKWVYAGRPKGKEDGGAGELLCERCRLREITARRGGEKKHRVGLDHRTIPLTADDWVPQDCHAPANVPGLISKVKGEANQMISNINRISGTIEALTVDVDATIIDKQRHNMSNMTGVDVVDLIGNDAIMDENLTVGSSGDVIPTVSRDLGNDHPSSSGPPATTTCCDTCEWWCEPADMAGSICCRCDLQNQRGATSQ